VILVAAMALFAGIPAEAETGPFVRVLGTVQDGGLPHAGCSCERCEAARADPALDRSVASLAIVAPSEESARVMLVDATPDVTNQLPMLRDIRPWPAGRVNRRPVDGVILTHAHIGHYLGLAQFGFEVMHTPGVDVHCTPEMAAFLRDNAPWDQLIAKEEIILREAAPGESFPLGSGVLVTLVEVPHRNEYADTVAVRIEGPATTVLYVPDTDEWRGWNPSFMDQLDGVDVAILDGSFYSMDELPGRRIEDVKHPLMTQTMDLLQPLVDAGTVRVLFTHLNPSNPALTPGSDAQREIERRGFEIAAEGMEIQLGAPAAATGD
jgi:pyrroloquinoline quinone biosynthesis protein B